MAVHRTTIELNLEQVTAITEWFRKHDTGDKFFIIAEPLIGKSKMQVFAWTGDDADTAQKAMRDALKITKPFNEYAKKRKA